MKIYPKQVKTDKQQSDFYFGDYGEIPIGISLATINKKGLIEDKLHYHNKGFEFYITMKGSGIVEVEGEEIELNNEKVIMVEPGEKHKIKSVLEAPFSFIAICNIKNKEDKIVLG